MRQNLLQMVRIATLNLRAAITATEQKEKIQTNVVSARVAATIRKEEGVIQKASVTLTSGVGGQSYGAEVIMNINISLT